LVGQDQDELEVAGALHGQPLEVVKSISNDLMIPAQAEIAIEGFFVPGVREPEGPFGEFTQYYGPKGERFVIEITTVTHRKSPLFHTINAESDLYIYRYQHPYHSYTVCLRPRWKSSFCSGQPKHQRKQYGVYRQWTHNFNYDNQCYDRYSVESDHNRRRGQQYRRRSHTMIIKGTQETATWH